jgi:hypothetical protein
MDAYRLDSTPEAEELDLDSMLADGVLLIEWPERMDGLIPSENLWIELEHIDEEEREMKFNARGKHYDDLLEHLRHAIAGGADMLLAVDTSTTQVGLALYDGLESLPNSRGEESTPHGGTCPRHLNC